MYVLIDTDNMDLVAKHPDPMVLYSLGIIICPDSSAVMPLRLNMLKDLVNSELIMLYIGITLESPNEEWNRDQLNYLLINLMNEAPETILDNTSVYKQADYSIEWGIEGHCSYVKGKKEPNMDEGLWENIIIDFNSDTAEKLLSDNIKIVFKNPLQLPLTII